MAYEPLYVFGLRSQCFGTTHLCWIVGASSCVRINICRTMCLDVWFPLQRSGAVEGEEDAIWLLAQIPLVGLQPDSACFGMVHCYISLVATALLLSLALQNLLRCL